MKKLLLLNGTICLLMTLSFTSCNQIESYKASEAKIAELRYDSAITHEMLDECYARTNNLNDENILLQDKNDSVQNNL
jgi:hypothetical protein